MTRVAVLAGGPSSEHDVSLETSAAILDALRSAGRAARPVLITRDGRWIAGDARSRLDELPGRAPISLDDGLAELAGSGELAVLGLHGRFGEDGTVQRRLEAVGIPYTGSGAVASELCMDKDLAKHAAARVGATCAPHVVATAGSNVAGLLRRPGLPCVVKPRRGGSSVATAIVRAAADLPVALAAAVAEDPGGEALIEAFVAGPELTCATLRRRDGAIAPDRRGRPACLPLVAIETPGAAFYDYHAKYHSDATRLVCPAPVTPAVAREIERVSTALFTGLELRGLVRVDFILDRERGVPVFLEVNTLPGLTSHSLVPLAGRTAGLDLTALLEALLADAGEGR